MVAQPRDGDAVAGRGLERRGLLPHLVGSWLGRRVAPQDQRLPHAVGLHRGEAPRLTTGTTGHRVQVLDPVPGTGEVVEASLERASELGRRVPEPRRSAHAGGATLRGPAKPKRYPATLRIWISSDPSVMR